VAGLLVTITGVRDPALSGFGASGSCAVGVALEQADIADLRPDDHRHQVRR